ncbi:MAG: SDR family NAD(P)-dependent oxidoreductase [Alphaproteobacteria bacterium]|nr:SDR family NAD(P)-dependent oxidoreductase [Alphaproteobacteria bacterium]
MNGRKNAVAPTRLAARYGSVAVVTGASEGIGRAFAQALAKAGLDLILVARREKALAALAAELTAAHRVAVEVLALDLADPASCDTLLARTQGRDVGLLVAAAGFGTSGPLISSDPHEERAMIDVNCRAVVHLAQGFAARFVARGRGGLVLMSSLVAFQGTPFAANYAATKAYVQTLAEGLRAELKPKGVDVIASAPGPIRSGFAARANMRMGLAQGPRAVAQATLNALGRKGTVRPGWLAKGLEASLALLPRAGRTAIMARVMGGMTKHQNAQTKTQAAGSA